MRMFHVLLLLPLFAAPALGQSSPPPAADHHAKKSAADHFTDANTTHDGHLTLDQATSGYKSIAKSFTQIDVNHHGYVTMDDIKAWKASKKAERQAAKHAASDTQNGVVRPGHPIPRWSGMTPLETSTDMFVRMPVEPRRTGVDLPKARLDGAQAS